MIVTPSLEAAMRPPCSAESASTEESRGP